MAEQVPYGVAVSLINKLASSTYREFGRIYGVMDQLQKLKQTLESIKVVLSDAEQRQSEDPVVGHWICRFRQVLHDADDLLDRLAIKDLRRKVDGDSKSSSKVRGFFSSHNPLVFRAKLARKIEKIRKSFSDVAEDMSKLKLNPSLVFLKQSELAWRETSSFVLQSEIIGRKKNVNDIMNLLKQTHANQHVSLIAIVGMGGLGKTALAQLVYNAAREQKIFQKYMWVCISEDFEVKTVLRKVLKSLKRNEVGDIELDVLQQMLVEELNGQRYMLVLDDLWNESHLKWNALRTYLMWGCEGSNILVTTRSKSVAQTMGINTPYLLEGLTKGQSWTLLRKVTFGDNNSKMSPSIESIGEKIAGKCRGVPLAIRTMGGLLRSKHEESEWVRILEGDFWRLCGEKEGIMPVLKLSYQNLPLELRQCFAYCCLYPKDWRIDKNELIQLWMAQGYLENSNGTQSTEDLGNEYVKILLMRSFFQDTSMECGEIIKFKMHDLMHDLATSVAGNDYCLDTEGKGIVERPMHVSFLSPSSICSLDSLDASNLRTFFGLKIENEVGATPSIKFNFRYLRVLNLSRSSITKLPEFIDKLQHLRYLELSNCYRLISLPESIGNLVLLQTLKLNGCLELVFDVEVLTKLISLRHLYIDDCKAFEEMIPGRLEKLTSLVYLSEFVAKDDDADESEGGLLPKKKGEGGKLNELKELNIAGNLTISKLNLVKDVASESQDANLKAKEHIRFLKLVWEYRGTNKNSDSLQLLDNLCPHQNLKGLEMHGYPGVSFSSWLSSLTNIVEIEFCRFSGCQYLPPLERLTCLKKLNIRYMEELQCIYCGDISDVFFPSLETLVLEDCWNMSGWQGLGAANEENDIDNCLLLPSFPRLSSLKIQNCPMLTCMPTFPHLVEKLELYGCREKPLMGTCLVQLEPSSLFPLSTLRHLEIEEVGEVEAMPEDWMQNLISLEQLTLGGSNIFPALSRHLQHLPSELQTIKIQWANDHELDLWEDEHDDKTQSPPLFRCLRSLQNIIFEHCSDLRALTEQIGNLQSLRHLEIRGCSKLVSLPEAMPWLTNLQTLTIQNCPLLEDRCLPETGEDWPKIAHIPNRRIVRAFR